MLGVMHGIWGDKQEARAPLASFQGPPARRGDEVPAVRVDIPTFEKAFLTRQDLPEILDPKQLNSGAVYDIYEYHRRDFIEPQQLEVWQFCLLLAQRCCSSVLASVFSESYW